MVLTPKWQWFLVLSMLKKNLVPYLFCCQSQLLSWKPWNLPWNEWKLLAHALYVMCNVNPKPLSFCLVIWSNCIAISSVRWLFQSPTLPFLKNTSLLAINSLALNCVIPVRTYANYVKNICHLSLANPLTKQTLLVIG